MTEYLRLKQICLVAPGLEPVASDLSAILGIEICYRDEAVAAYGLDNVLYPVDATLLEIVAPTREGTAAGRFLDKLLSRVDASDADRGDYHGGYMAIFTASDVERRRDHARAMGVRIAHTIDKEGFYGVQLHPADCRAAFVDFNRTENSDGVYGPYTVAGENWQSFIRKDTTEALIGVEIESQNPENLCDHWGRIIEVPVHRNGDGEPELRFVNCTFRFVKGPNEVMGALIFKVTDVARVTAAATARGYKVRTDSAGRNAFHICGVTVRVV